MKPPQNKKMVPLIAVLGGALIIGQAPASHVPSSGALAVEPTGMKATQSKKVTAQIRLQVAAGEANPSPPVGPALGQHGVNIMEFCKAFNAKTQHMKKGLPINVVITVYADRSFTYIIETPRVPVLLKKAVLKGKKGKVTRAQIEEIAKIKEPDIDAEELKAAIQQIAGTARSMGIDVEGVE